MDLVRSTKCPNMQMCSSLVRQISVIKHQSCSKWLKNFFGRFPRFLRLSRFFMGNLAGVLFPNRNFHNKNWWKWYTINVTNSVFPKRAKYNWGFPWQSNLKKNALPVKFDYIFSTVNSYFVEVEGASLSQRDNKEKSWIRKFIQNYSEYFRS